MPWAASTHGVDRAGRRGAGRGSAPGTGCRRCAPVDRNRVARTTGSDRQGLDRQGDVLRVNPVWTAVRHGAGPGAAAMAAELDRRGRGRVPPCFVARLRPVRPDRPPLSDSERTVIAGLMVAAAGLLALPRPNAARVRLPALAAARGCGASKPSAARGRTLARAVPPGGRRRVRAAAPGELGSGCRHVRRGVPGRPSGSGFAGGGAAHRRRPSMPESGPLRARRIRSDDAALAQALSVLEAELAAGAREDAALDAAAAVSGRHGRLLREAAASTGYGAETADVLARSGVAAPAVSGVAGQARLRRAAGRGGGPGSTGRRPAPKAPAGREQCAGRATVLERVARCPSPGRYRPRHGDGRTSLPVSVRLDGGSMVLLVGVGLDVAGWLWTAAMVRRASR